MFSGNVGVYFGDSVTDALNAVQSSVTSKRRQQFCEQLLSGIYLHLDHILECRHATEGASSYEIRFKKDGKRASESSEVRVTSVDDWSKSYFFYRKFIRSSPYLIPEWKEHIVQNYEQFQSDLAPILAQAEGVSLDTFGRILTFNNSQRRLFHETLASNGLVASLRLPPEVATTWKVSLATAKSVKELEKLSKATRSRSLPLRRPRGPNTRRVGRRARKSRPEGAPANCCWDFWNSGRCDRGDTCKFKDRHLRGPQVKRE